MSFVNIGIRACTLTGNHKGGVFMVNLISPMDYKSRDTTFFIGVNNVRGRDGNVLGAGFFTPKYITTLANVDVVEGEILGSGGEMKGEYTRKYQQQIFHESKIFKTSKSTDHAFAVKD